MAIEKKEKRRCKRNIIGKNTSGNKVSFKGFNVCKDGNIGLLILRDVTILTTDN